MPKVKPFRKLSIDEDICQAALARIAAERRHVSLTEFVCEIVDWYLHDLLVKVEERPAGSLITAAKIESHTVTHERSKAG